MRADKFKLPLIIQWLETSRRDIRLSRVARKFRSATSKTGLCHATISSFTWRTPANNMIFHFIYYFIWHLTQTKRERESASPCLSDPIKTKRKRQYFLYLFDPTYCFSVYKLFQTRIKYAWKSRSTLYRLFFFKTKIS